MARPLLPIGTWGKINYTERAGKPAAYAKFRDFDGITRQVLRTGRTQAIARTALLEEFSKRAKPSLGTVTRDTTVTELADIFETEMMADTSLADQTKLNYKSKLRTIRAGLGGVRLSEATPPRLDRFVQAVAKTYPGAARSLRSVLKSMMALAVLHGAHDTNPVAEIRNVKRATPTFTALRAPELAEVRQLLRIWDRKPIAGHPRGGSLTDTMDMYLATGVRTAEVLAFDFPSLRLDTEPYGIVVDKTVAKNIEGKLFIQPHTKTSDIRTLELPDSVASMLIRRRVHATSDLIFPSAVKTPRWPDSLRRDWREALRGSKFEGLKPGIYRKAVATHLAERLGVEKARDQLGHRGLANLVYYVEPTSRVEAGSIIDELFQNNAD